MSRDHAVDATFAENFNVTNPVMDAARTISHEYGLAPVSTTTAETIRLLCQLQQPAAVVEVGTGVGVTSLALLAAMPAAAILTTIDPDAEAQAAARELIEVARIKAHRVRLINGRAEDVLPRLAPGSYDLVVVDSEPLTVDRIVEPAINLLSPGGLLLLHQALLAGAVAKPANRAPRTQVMRRVLNTVQDRHDVQRLLLPIGDGLLVLRRTSA